tara:strand:+ start:267 stop:473 length:207 start_codon:yes stop_codon:yes gene_type:complete
MIITILLVYAYCGFGLACATVDTVANDGATKGEKAKEFYLIASLWPLMMGSAIYEKAKTLFKKQEPEA